MYIRANVYLYVCMCVFIAVAKTQSLTRIYFNTRSAFRASSQAHMRMHTYAKSEPGQGSILFLTVNNCQGSFKVL